MLNTKRLLHVLPLGALLLVASPQASAIEDGMYLSLGLGYASVSGARGKEIEFDNLGPCPDSGHFLWFDADKSACWTGEGRAGFMSTDEYLNEVLKTDFGSGLGLQLRMGWNIKGYVSPELALYAHGNTLFSEGGGHPSLRARLHPAEFWIHHDDRDWDASVFFGGGFSMGGYSHPEEFKRGDDDDGKGWSGWHMVFGATFDYAVHDVLSFALDLNVMKVGYVTWIVNWNDNIHSLTKETPSTWVVAPTLMMKFHLGDGEEPPKPNLWDHKDDPQP
ncbi:MAG: hypothetical protein VX938_09140 [Myxococcota bacterium]|nr:hypothetical protein [Myxococcota bacterium]MEE2779535.1 hypothetical protein [Myxococcota bacterium]